MKGVFNCMGHATLFEDIIGAENCTLFDSKGNEYLDLESGVWCASVGHCNPRVVGALQLQSSLIMHTGYSYLSPVTEKAAQKILSLTNQKNGSCLFLSSGSEAVDVSIKISREATKRKRVLTMKDSYLSAFGSFSEKREDEWLFFDWRHGASLDGIDFADIASFVFEPGSSSGEVRFPPAETVAEIARRVRLAGGLVVANEVTTGIGRTGEWFGYNHYGLSPDIVAMGKGLGNGYPVSCVALSEETAEKADYRSFHYGQSHQNDPLGAAVALEVISVIEDGKLLAKAREDGERLLGGIAKIGERYGIIAEARGRGLMIAVEFEKSEKRSYAEEINAMLLGKRIILVKRPGLEIFRLDPSLTISGAEIDYFLSELEECVRTVRDGIKTKGTQGEKK